MTDDYLKRVEELIAPKEGEPTMADWARNADAIRKHVPDMLAEIKRLRKHLYSLKHSLAHVNHQMSEMCLTLGIDPTSGMMDIHRAVEKNASTRTALAELAEVAERIWSSTWDAHYSGRGITQEYAQKVDRKIKAAIASAREAANG